MSKFFILTYNYEYYYISVSLIRFFHYRRGAKMDHLQTLDSLLKQDYDRRATPTNHLSKFEMIYL